MSANQNSNEHDRMRELIGKIHDADVAYYQQDCPIMTDREYDQLVDELQALETETGLILSNSPTQHVGGEILDELVPVRHTKPMLSAGKTKQVEDLVKFAAGRAVLLSWKMDGLTIVLRYENGGLQQAITRGRDGIIGEDVTHTVRTFLNVPLTIPIREPFEVRGEGVISWDNFEKVNLSLGGDYTHPRNLAAGSVRKLDSGESRKRKLEFWAFDLVSDIFDSFQFGIGDTIKVYRANMIIPQIAENKTRSNTFFLPLQCPCCGHSLSIRQTSGGTRQLYCENPHCAAKLVQKFAHFCEKTRMNIEGLSAVTLEKFIGHGWVKNFGDLYQLDQFRDEIISTDGFGEKSYERIHDAIEKSRSCTLAKFIAGLGIPMVGRHAGRELDRFFHGSWDEFEAALQKHFDFTVLPDFGQTMNDNIYAWYADKEEEKLWRPLLAQVHFKKENTDMESIKKTPFWGKTVVATGKLMGYTRDGIQEKLLMLGARPASSVTKKTDYLIVGEKAGSKLTKAQQLGIQTLTEEEFENMIAE